MPNSSTSDAQQHLFDLTEKIKHMTTMFENIGSKVDSLNHNLLTISERQENISARFHKSEESSSSSSNSFATSFNASILSKAASQQDYGHIP